MAPDWKRLNIVLHVAGISLRIRDINRKWKTNSYGRTRPEYQELHNANSSANWVRFLYEFKHIPANGVH